MILYNNIVNPPINTSIQNPNQTYIENKNIFSKSKEWIGNQRDYIRDKGKWKTEWLKNLLRTTWFAATWIWAIALVYKSIKKFFWRRKKDNSDKEKELDDPKKEENTESNKKKDKKFLDTRYWKTLKWVWIIGAAWWWGYYLWKKLSWWWNEYKQIENNSTQNQTENTYTQNKESLNTKITESKENETTKPDKISNEMFEQLLKMEGKHKEGNNLIARTGKQFWEKFPTWPFGMVYKHIDESWNPLKKAVPFKEWEKVTEDRWKKNAKAYYDKRAKEWKDILDSKWYKYTQCMLDSLVCQSWWTKKSTNNLKEYVTSHWNNKDGIFNFISKHATTAAWNWKVMPGLVKRAKFAANRFIWNKKPFKEYKA